MAEPKDETKSTEIAEIAETVKVDPAVTTAEKKVASDAKNASEKQKKRRREEDKPIVVDIGDIVNVVNVRRFKMANVYTKPHTIFRPEELVENVVVDSWTASQVRREHLKIVEIVKKAKK